MHVLPERQVGQLRPSPNFDQLEQEALELLRLIFADKIHGKAALVSSFGSESAVLLHLASRVNPDIPVLFIDTLMLFEETLHYQLELAQTLGLSNVIRILPDLHKARDADPYGRLHLSDPDSCCDLRKIKPLEENLCKYNAWVSGRKRFHGEDRAQLAVQELDEQGRHKFNPLADWQAGDIKAYFERHELPRNPLFYRGFRSIGCSPCTVAVGDGEDSRSGRWQGQEKTECGIHLVDGKLVKKNTANEATR
ncbi:MAG: phosphoadenylyl-sulfate reductase [Hyphomicrobiales bacterium]